MKKVFFYLALGFLALLIFSISSEVFLRVYSHFTPTLFSSKDKKYNQFRANPNSWINGFQLNQKGFQDEEFVIPKKEGTIRILALGDSFTFGVVPYQNNFVTLLETQLKEKNPSIEILNMGIPSTTVRDYLDLLVDEGLALNPDGILLNLYIGNDIFETEKKQDSSLYLVRFFRFLSAYSKVNTKVKGQIPKLGGANKENLYDDSQKSLEDKIFYGAQKEMFVIYFNHKTIRNYLNHKYQSMFKDIETIHRICQSKKIKLHIALLPAEIQVDTNLQKIIEKELKDSSYSPIDSYENLIGSIDYSLPNILIKQELEKQKISHIDLLEPFRRKALTEKLYKPNDTHWNIAGNSFATEVLFSYFLKEADLF